MGGDLAQRIADAFEPGMLPGFAIAPHFHELMENIEPLRRKCFELFSTTINTTRAHLLVQCLGCNRWSVALRPHQQIINLLTDPPTEFDRCRACSKMITTENRMWSVDSLALHKYILLSRMYGGDQGMIF
jgi:hypothetical protein